MKKAPSSGPSVISETTESSSSSTAATQLTHEAKNNQTTTPTATNNNNSLVNLSKVNNNSNNPPVIKCTTTTTITADKSTKTDESLLMNGMEALNVAGNGVSQTSANTVASVVAKSAAENNGKITTSVIPPPPMTRNAATMTTSSSVPINASDVHAFPLPQPASGSNLNATSISESSIEQPVTPQNPPVGKLSYAQAAQLLREGNKEAASSNVNEKVPQETTVVPKETKQQKKEGNEAGNRERKG